MGHLRPSAACGWKKNAIFSSPPLFLLKKTKPTENIADSFNGHHSPWSCSFFLITITIQLCSRSLSSLYPFQVISLSLFLYIWKLMSFGFIETWAILDGFTGKRNSQLLPCQCSSSSSSDDNPKPTNPTLHYEGRRALIGSLLTSGLC